MQNIKAKKSLGQNFLIDEVALSDIANGIDITDKHIIEVGPGYGALTDYIVFQSPLTLDLVELDRDMIDILENKYNVQCFTSTEGGKAMNSWGLGEETVGVSGEKEYSGAKLPSFSSPNTFGTFGTKSTENGIGKTQITLHNGDILKFTPPYEQYSVIANIPYYITSPILFHFLYGVEDQPDEMIIMMQEEVGEKIMEGRAKKPHHSFLSLCMELACDDIEILRNVGRKSFDPSPKVDSIVLKFTVKNERNNIQEKELMNLWKVAFAHPRKTLLSNLKGSIYNSDTIRTKIIELNYDERIRAEAIKKEDWIEFL